MRALVLKEFGRLEIEERPRPEPGPGEVLLEVLRTGICGSDIHGYTGRNGRRVPGQVMGHESVARVAGVGEGVSATDFPPGRVATFNPVVLPERDLTPYRGREQHSPDKKVIGVAPEIVAAFAEVLAVPARNVVLLPESMPVAYGALIEPIAVAVHAVKRAGVRPGHRVLVLGGGPIGQSVILSALRAGAARVLVSEPDEGRRALCAQLGATVLAPDGSPVADLVAAELGAPADVALDAVGVSASLSDALLSTAFGGTVCLVGMGSPELAIDAYRVSTEERSLAGSFSYSAADFQEAADWVATAPDVLGTLISREVDLENAPAVFEELAGVGGIAGKVLVRVAGSGQGPA